VDEDWDSIADWYAALVREGSAMHEFSRDILLVEVPADLTNTCALDLGCGEGLITRALAERGAVALGVDPAAAMVAHAQDAERASPVGARYRVDDGSALSTVDDASIDFVTAALSLNNIRDLPAAMTAIGRVLMCGGHLVFTVPHPCFDAPGSSAATVDGVSRRLVGDYFAEGFWRSDNPTSVRRAGNYHRTISTYLEALLDQGFRIESVAEPAPTSAVAQAHPHRAHLPPFLRIHAVAPERRPMGSA
jgi:ubiquinone/menaquinone biosynthesis C-methylase UbiE